MQPTKRGEDLAAAQMAKILFGELQAVDQMTIEQTNDPNKRANRIDMDKFIAPLVGKQSQQHEQNFTYVPEELVQSMVPDTAIGSRPPAPNLIPLPPGYEAPPNPYVPQAAVVPISNHTEPPKSQPLVLGTGMDDVTKGNIASIANNLVLLRKDFAKVLGPLLSFLKSQEPVKSAQQIVNGMSVDELSRFGKLDLPELLTEQSSKVPMLSEINTSNLKEVLDSNIQEVNATKFNKKKES